MPCEVTGPRGRCKMPALKGQPFCFAHHPEAQTARSAARTKGGANRRRPTSALPPAPATPSLPTFDLRVARKSDIPHALLRLAQAIANGTVDTRRGRLLAEALRAAAFAFSADPHADDDANAIPEGARELSDAEHRYVIDHQGRLPPSVELYGDVRPFLVTGPVWVPPDDDVGEAAHEEI